MHRVKNIQEECCIDRCPKVEGESHLPFAAVGRSEARSRIESPEIQGSNDLMCAVVDQRGSITVVWCDTLGTNGVTVLNERDA